jgi:G3E family GTPase
MSRLYLITGFLGSGKTTLLDNLLSELLPEKRIAVIQNEFASTSIDGRELLRRHEGLTLLEINNGSVFCVCQLANFERALVECLDLYDPEAVFLEASGLADPISVIDLLDTEDLRGRIGLDQVICLVDAPNFARGMSELERVRHQLMVADRVVINKTDLFEGDVDEVRKTIAELNPFARFDVTSYAKIPWKSIIESQAGENRAAERFRGSKSRGRPDTAACVIRTQLKLDEVGVMGFLRSLQADCPRVKGYINLEDGRTVSVQSVYETIELVELEGYQGPTEVIAFGQGLTAGRMRQLYEQCVNRG